MNTHLYNAIIQGNLDIVKSFETFNLESRDNNGFTPLHLAVRYGKLDIVKYLVDKNVDIDSKDNEGCTPLHFAVENGKFDIIKYLAEKDVNLESKDNFGETPLHLAAEHDKFEIVEFLFRNDVDLEPKTFKDLTPLHQAAEFGCLKIVQYLTDKNVELEPRDEHGKTPFHLAVRKNELNVVKHFVQKKVDLNSSDNNGKTALHFAKEFHSNKVFWYLLSIKNMVTTTHFDNESDIVQWIKTNVDCDIICHQERDIHIISECFVKFDCGHSYCVKCILTEVNQNSLKILFCCLKNVRKFTTYDLIRYFSFINVQSVLSFATVNLKTMLASLAIITENCKTKFQLIINKYTSFEDDIDKRYEYMRTQVDVFEKDLIRNINRRKMLWIHYLKSKADIKPYKIIPASDQLCFLLKTKFLLNRPTRKEFGLLKVAQINSRGKKNCFNLNKITATLLSDKTNIEKKKMLHHLLKNIKTPSECKIEDSLFITKQLEKLIESSSLSTCNDFKELTRILTTLRSCLKGNAIQNSINAKNQNIDVKKLIEIRKSLVRYKIEIKNSNKQIENEIQSLFPLNKIELNENEIQAFYLIKNGKLEALKLLMKEENSNMRIDAKNDGLTMLLCAVFNEQFEMVKFLIEEYNANLNEIDKYGATICQIAVYKNKSNEIINYLTAEKNLKTPHQHIENLLKKNYAALADLNLDSVDNINATLLHYIAAFGDVALLNLIDDISKVNNEIKDVYGLTCLDIAASKGHLEMTKQLLNCFKLNKNIDVLISIFEKALLFSHNLEIIKWSYKELKNNNYDLLSNDKTLMFYIGGRTPPIVKEKIEFLISCGDNINVKDESGNNLIMNLIVNDQIQNVDMKIFENIFDINQKNIYGQNLTHLAATKGHLDILKYCHLKNISINDVDSNGHTPLMYATKYGFIDIVEWLLSIDTSGLNDVNNCGMNSADIAILNNFVQIADVFERNSIKPNFYFLSNPTVSYSEINKCNFNIVKSIIEEPENEIYYSKSRIFKYILKWIENCELNNLLKFKFIEDLLLKETKMNILHIAAALGRNDLILWLFVNNKIDVNTKDKFGQNALFYAALNENLETVLLLKLIGLETLFENNNPISAYFMLKEENLKFIDLDSVLSSLQSGISTYVSALEILNENIEQQRTFLNKDEITLKKIFFAVKNDCFFGIVNSSIDGTSKLVVSDFHFKKIIEIGTFCNDYKYIQIEINKSTQNVVDLSGMVYLAGKNELIWYPFNQSQNKINLKTYEALIQDMFLIYKNTIILMFSQKFIILNTNTQTSKVQNISDDDKIESITPISCKKPINCFENEEKQLVFAVLTKSRSINIYKTEIENDNIGDIRLEHKLASNVNICSNLKIYSTNEEYFKIFVCNYNQKSIEIHDTENTKLTGQVSIPSLVNLDFTDQMRFRFIKFYINEILFKIKIHEQKWKIFNYNLKSSQLVSIKSNECAGNLKAKRPKLEDDVFNCENLYFIDELNEYFICESTNKYHIKFELYKLNLNEYSHKTTINVPLLSINNSKTNFLINNLDETLLWADLMNTKIYQVDFSCFKEYSLFDYEKYIENMFCVLSVNQVLVEIRRSDGMSEFAVVNTETKEFLQINQVGRKSENIIVCGFNEYFLVLFDMISGELIICRLSYKYGSCIFLDNVVLPQTEKLTLNCIKKCCSCSSKNMWIICYFEAVQKIVVKCLKPELDKDEWEEYIIHINNLCLSKRSYKIECLITEKNILLAVWNSNEPTIYFRSIVEDEPFSSICFEENILCVSKVPNKDELVVKCGTSVYKIHLIKGYQPKLLNKFENDKFCMRITSDFMIIASENTKIYELSDLDQSKLLYELLNLQLYKCYITKTHIIGHKSNNDLYVKSLDGKNGVSLIRRYLKTHLFENGIIYALVNGTIKIFILTDLINY